MIIINNRQFLKLKFLIKRANMNVLSAAFFAGYGVNLPKDPNFIAFVSFTHQ